MSPHCLEQYLQSFYGIEFSNVAHIHFIPIYLSLDLCLRNIQLYKRRKELLSDQYSGSVAEEEAVCAWDGNDVARTVIALVVGPPSPLCPSCGSGLGL